MKLIKYSDYTGEENMQIDADILENAISSGAKEPVFRLYGWKPKCISLGRNQNPDFIDKDVLKKNNIDVVKRLTGGRALLHDNEITYSCIFPVSYLQNGENVTKSYMEISQFLINMFASTGIELDFGTTKPVNTKHDYCMLISTGADLCYRGKKLIGSAQCRKNGYILQHGSILYDFNRDLLEKIFKEPINESSVTCVRLINPELSREKLVELLTNYITNY